MQSSTNAYLICLGPGPLSLMASMKTDRDWESSLPIWCLMSRDAQILLSCLPLTASTGTEHAGVCGSMRGAPFLEVRKDHFFCCGGVQSLVEREQVSAHFYEWLVSAAGCWGSPEKKHPAQLGVGRATELQGGNYSGSVPKAEEFSKGKLLVDIAVREIMLVLIFREACPGRLPHHL